MLLQSMLDRLQCDIRRIYGIEPQLRVSRISLYERLWKELLVLIENIEDSKVFDIQQVEPQSTIMVPPCDFSTEKLSNGKPCLLRLLVWHASSESALRVALSLDVPSELADLVYGFLYTRNSGLLRAIRQVCLFTYKSRSNEITPEQTETAILGFLSRNQECRGLSSLHYRHMAAAAGLAGQTLKVARLLIRHILSRWDHRDIKPSHGPGAVADAGKGIDKWKSIDGACSRICDKMYPISEFFAPSPGEFDHSSARFVDNHAKLAIVPKDKRGPRIICTQPSSAMWIQQGQMRSISKTIESARILRFNRNGETGSSIKFDNQEQNGSLALESSRTREYATIDLKDASDLISWGLIQFLLSKEDLRALAATRSTHVQLPNKELVKLHMFAPMGSAMCFPVESLVFWVIATAAMHVQDGVKYEALCHDRALVKSVLSAWSRCYVFGDDVLVPSDRCRHVCDMYEAMGFKPNYAKTFHKGFYRESCGVDAYLGGRLDIYRLQVHTLTSMSDAYATIDLANRAGRNGMHSLCEYLRAQVESFLGFSLAATVKGSGGALWDNGYPGDRYGAWSALTYSVLNNASIRFNYRYQCWEARSIIARPLLAKEPQDGRCRLFRGLTVGVDEHTMDWLSPDSTQYYLGWVIAF